MKKIIAKKRHLDAKLDDAEQFKVIHRFMYSVFSQSWIIQNYLKIFVYINIKKKINYEVIPKKCNWYTPYEKDTFGDSTSNFFLSNFDSFMFLTYLLGIEIAKKKNYMQK